MKRNESTSMKARNQEYDYCFDTTVLINYTPRKYN